MPDWIREASRKIDRAKFSASEREEVSRELASYLEDLCNESRASGADEAAAVARAAGELHEDLQLGVNLYRARREDDMHDRTKRLWLPGITLFLASAATLAVFQLIAGYIYAAYAPTPHGNNLPGLMVWLMKHRSAALIVYLGWLYMLPFLGAAGAWWSRRAGSSRGAQVAAGFFPLLLFLAIFVGQFSVAREGTVLPFLAIGDLPPAQVFFPFMSTTGSLFLSWVVIPGAALLLGVLPFLLASQLRAKSSPRTDSAISV